MPLETATYISDLNASNPAASDQLAQADDHMRLIKSTLKTTFPNINGAVTATDEQLNALLTLFVGTIQAFPKAPSGLLTGGTSGAATWLECDGSTYTFADHPNLGPFLGSTFGGNGTTTFGVPNLKDTGRFLRSRTNSVAVGTSQANQNKSHTHTYSGSSTTGLENQGWTHSFSGTTSGQSADHSHTYNTKASTAFMGNIAAGPQGWTGDAGASTSGASNDHTHTFSGVTGVQNANHNHNFSWSGTTSTGSADGTEARPEAFVVIYAIKT